MGIIHIQSKITEIILFSTESNISARFGDISVEAGKNAFGERGMKDNNRYASEIKRCIVGIDISQYLQDIMSKLMSLSTERNTCIRFQDISIKTTNYVLFKMRYKYH